ncbi:MAG: DUF4232 domain-containing protein [Gaiellales bacterium]
MLAAPPACHASQLAVTLGGSDGTAGTIYYTILFRNTSGTTCSLRGYPGVSSVGGADGHQIGSAARRDPKTVVTVVLRPRAFANASYGQAEALNYPKARCHPESARGLRVYSPNVRSARYLALKHLACSSTGVGDSHVAPLRAGR